MTRTRDVLGIPRLDEMWDEPWQDAPDDPEPWAWRRRKALLARHVQSGERVLDLGCGAGRFMSAALEAGAARVAGVDIAAGARDRARRRLPTCQVESGTARFAEGAFDLVWCSEVVGFVHDTWAFLTEARRVGGRLVLTTPDHRGKFDPCDLDPFDPVVRRFTRPTLEQALKTVGYEDVKVSRDGELLVAEAR